MPPRHTPQAPAAPGDESDRIARHLRQLEALVPHERRLRSSADAGQLFARAAALTRTELGFARGLVLSVAGNLLVAGESLPLEHDESDRLRLRVLAAPITVASGTLEHALIRGSLRRPPGAAPRPVQLRGELGLEHAAIAPIAPDGRTLALLVADRPTPFDALELTTVLGVALMVGHALEHVVVRMRMGELGSAVRYMAASSQALMAEVAEAPVAIPSSRNGGYTFVGRDMLPGGADGSRLLTEREEQVAMLLVEGRTNREIAERLMISTETVKDRIARVRRKLGAANRVEAAARYLQLVQAR